MKVETLYQAILWGILGAMITFAILDAAGMPDVWFSYSTDECVKVINYNPDDKYSCENLPNKFNHVWVK
jgi:hypothetical protein